MKFEEQDGCSVVLGIDTGMNGRILNHFQWLRFVCQNWLTFHTIIVVLIWENIPNYLSPAYIAFTNLWDEIIFRSFSNFQHDWSKCSDDQGRFTVGESIFILVKLNQWQRFATKCQSQLLNRLNCSII